MLFGLIIKIHKWMIFFALKSHYCFNMSSCEPLAVSCKLSLRSVSAHLFTCRERSLIMFHRHPESYLWVNQLVTKLHICTEGVIPNTCSHTHTNTDTHTPCWTHECLLCCLDLHSSRSEVLFRTGPRASRAGWSASHWGHLLLADLSVTQLLQLVGQIMSCLLIKLLKW